MIQDALTVNDLSVSFRTSGNKSFPIVNKVSFSLKKGRRTALVGESGCGKSLLALALFRLLPHHALVTGTATYNEDCDLLSVSEKKMNRLRGKNLVLVPQNAAGHLDPTLRIGYQLKEGLKQKQAISGRKAVQVAHSLLRQVGFEHPETICRLYPHQLSGGMAQRILLAVGLSASPDIVVADEPTRGLDAQNQRRYLELMQNLYRDSALLVITHQLDAAGECDWLLVMYGGEIVEEGPANLVLSRPYHPYTKGLLMAHPDKGMQPIPGQPFSFRSMAGGCRFSTRCTYRTDICTTDHPYLRSADNSRIRCHHAGC